MAFDYKGVFCIHSVFSHDGITGIKEIIRSAKRCAAYFIVITNHFNMKAKDKSFEGWYDNLLFICSGE